MDIKQNYSLKKYNTFGLEAKAAFFVEVQKIDELQAVLKDEHLKSLSKLILGGGSNLLFTKDFDGLVIKNEIKGIQKVDESDLEVGLKVGAGVVWHEFVLYCIENNLSGVENLSLIPGTVGAAPMQNIGAYGAEIKDVFESLEAVRIADGELKVFDNPTCKFGYRESIFKNEVKGQYIIVSVTFRLKKMPVFNTSYGAIMETLQQMGVNELSIKAISDAVIKIRKSKLPDPAEIGNAGSFFKNPEISTKLFESIKAQYPEIPGYPVANDKIKIPAGWLIEKCGWKGRQVGNVGVHKNQALVLVNYGQGTGEEIRLLAASIQESVKQKFGVDLTPEVNFI